MDAVVRPHVRVGSDVFAQHAGLLAADPTLLADVLPSPPAADVHVLLVRFVSAGCEGSV